jgi:predicted acyltransferase
MPAPASNRLVSLDALRGFDMCWILGLSSAVLATLQRFLPGSSLTENIKVQFEHVAWAGFHFEDLIFPLFLFIAGVSMPLALPGRVARDGRSGAVKHLIIRALVIFLLGVFYSGGMMEGFDKIRWLGVLQRIGLASCVAGILSLWLGTRALIAVGATLLIGYYLMLQFIPVPEVGAGNFAEGMNLTNYLDSIWLPGRKYDGDHDPEGILSTLPAIVTALLGVLAGQWLKSETSPNRKVLGLIVAGAALLGLGWAFHPLFPVVKKLWSSSFVLVAGGWSAILLGVFFWIIDVRGWKRWSTLFVWVGMNPITLYLIAGLGVFSRISERITGPQKGDLRWIFTMATFLVMLGLARWLYRRGIFLRV